MEKGTNSKQIKHMLSMYLIDVRNGPLILPNKYDIRRVRKK